MPRHWPETRTSSRVREMGSADDIVYESTGFILNSQMVKPQLGWFVEVQKIPYCFTEEPLTGILSQVLSWGHAVQYICKFHMYYSNIQVSFVPCPVLFLFGGHIHGALAMEGKKDRKSVV